MNNPFILAPMAGITDMPFRRLLKKLGAGCVISEFVSAHAVVHNSPKNERYMAIHQDEKPVVGIQLFGGDEDVLVEAAKKTQDRGVDFIDLNLGCPVPKVTKKGGGSAWLCHPVDLGKLLGRMVKELDVPLTIKIRTGWDSESINAKEIVRIAAEEGVHWVAIHGRTRAQGYSGVANWDFIKELSAESPIPIIGNGDIISGAQATARLIQSGCHGVMIGRGALKNPWIFMEAVEALEKIENLDEEQKLALAASVLNEQKLPESGSIPPGKDYYQKKVKKMQPVPVNFVADWVRIRSDRDARALMDLHLGYLRDFYPEQRVQLAFRKFLAWYSAGYPGSHQFRKYIFTTKVFQDVISKAEEFFESVKSLGSNSDQMRDAEPVFMKGHG